MASTPAMIMINRQGAGMLACGPGLPPGKVILVPYILKMTTKVETLAKAAATIQPGCDHGCSCRDFVWREWLRNETFPPGTAGRSATIPSLQSSRNRFLGPRHHKMKSPGCNATRDNKIFVERGTQANFAIFMVFLAIFTQFWPNLACFLRFCPGFGGFWRFWPFSPFFRLIKKSH